MAQDTVQCVSGGQVRHASLRNALTTLPSTAVAENKQVGLSSSWSLLRTTLLDHRRITPP